MKPVKLWTRVAAGGVVMAAALGGAWLALPRPPLLEGVSYSRRVTDRNGTLLWMSLSADDKYRVYRPLSRMAPEVARASLAQEDRYFDFHPGINPVAVARAVVQLLGRGHYGSGASTITMQVARLRFHLRTRSLGGKAEQMVRALELERHYSKAEILEAYLNLAPYGGNIEGMEAASEIYFGKGAGELTLPEAAALAVIPQNPVKRGLKRGMVNERQRAAQNRLLAKMGAAAETLAFRAQREGAMPFLAPHFTRQVLQEPGDELATTLDLERQRMLEGRMAGYLRAKSASGVRNAAALLVDAHGMEVLAQAGSADFREATIHGQVDGTLSRRSPGSTLKPFVYALALQQGLIHPLSILHDAPVSFAGYNPENYDREFAGPIRAGDALARSRNIPAVLLAAQLNHPTLYEFLRNAGTPLPKAEGYYGLALPLGGAEISMQNLVTLYGALANDGELQGLVRRRGETSQKKRVLSPEACFLTLEMLRSARPGLADAGASEPIFWKTGTSTGYRDAWAVGVFDHYVLAVWVGNADGRGNAAFVGRTCAAPLLFQMIDGLRGAGLARLEEHVPPAGANLRRAEFCAVSGKLATPLCKHRVEGWFIPGVSPIATCDVHREVYVDEATGMRVGAAGPGVKREVYEFWPDDLLKLYRAAGLPRRTPPPYLPGSNPATWQAGKVPRITQPKVVGVYQMRSGEDELALRAETEEDVAEVFWFAGRQFLGRAKAGESLAWRPEAGKYVLTAVDDAGRAGSEKVEVARLQE